MDAQNAGTAYLALPEAVPAPGILVLHAWWGLNGQVKAVCDQERRYSSRAHRHSAMSEERC